MVGARFRVEGAGVCLHSPPGDLVRVCGRWAGRGGGERTQPVGLADGGVQVDGERRVAGSRPSLPGPGQRLAAHPVQLANVAPPEAVQEGAQSLPSRKRGVDGALTVEPRVQAVLPVRNTSAASMQSPPASADATRVISLSPVLARPGALPRSR